MKKNILTLLVFLLSLAGSYAQKVRFYDVKNIDQYQQVLAQALEEKKMMYLVIYEDGDAFYQMQKDDVFADASLATAYEANIPLAVDIYSDMGARLAEAFTIDSLPSFLYLTDEEFVVLVKEGYQNVEQLKKALANAKLASEEYKTLQKKYSENTLTPQDWRKLLDFHGMNFSFEETKALAIGFLNGLNNSQLISQEIVPITATYGIDLETKYPEILFKNRQNLKDQIDFEALYTSVYSYNFDRAIASDDTVMLEKIVTLLLPYSTDTSASTPKLAFETRKVFASETRIFSVWRKGALERSETIEETSDSARAEFLFDEAYEIADNFNSEDAQKAARKLANQANKLNEKFRYKMLESYMAYLLKDYTEADALVKEAKLLTDNANNERKADNLQEMITEELIEEDTEE